MYGAVVAASALVLTACGGDDSGEDDEIAGVQSPSEEPEASEDPEPTEEPADGRPEIDLGPDLENVYDESELTGDPETDAALRSIEGFNDAVDEAIASFENDRPALRYYIADEALLATLDMLDEIYSLGESSAGTTRYYNRSVNLIEDDAATFSFCRDFSQVDTIDFETREVIEEADADAAATLYSGRMEQNESGVWQVVGYDLTNDGAGC